MAPEFIPNWGGTGTYLANLLKHLPRDVDIHVVTLKRVIKGEEQSCATTEEIAESLGRWLSIHYLSIARETFLYNLSFQIACLRELPKLCKRYDFDIIHSSHCHMPDLYYQLTRRKGIATIVTVHDFLNIKRESIRNSRIEFHRLDPSEKAIISFYPFLRLCEITYMKRIPAFIAPSQYIAGILRSLGIQSEQISVVPNGVDTSVFAPENCNRGADRESRPTVLFTGRLVSHKGIDTILRAIPSVIKQVPEVQFVFTGAGMPSRYLHWAKDRGILDKVKFLGYVRNYFEMSRLYSRADVFVLPSLFENCPMSLLEAMSSGVPAIATSVGGVPEIVTSGSNGILIRPHDADALAQSIILLMLDRGFASRLAKEGRRTVTERFSAERMADKTMNVYRAITKTTMEA